MADIGSTADLTPKQVLDGRTAFVYVRVSSEEQTETLETQLATIEDALKALGYRNSLKGRVFVETGSGTTLERPELAKALRAALEHGKPAAIVVRDIQRFSRDPYGMGVLYRPLWEADVPLVALTNQLVLGTRKRPQPGADLLAPILVAAGGSEVNMRKVQSKAAVQKSRERGIVAGAPLDVFSDEPLNPYRELDRLLKAGIGQNEASRRLNRSTSWFRKTRDKLAQTRERKGDAGVEDFLSLVDLIRDLEQRFGPRTAFSGKTGAKRSKKTGPKPSDGMVAVGRMTSLFLQEPWDNDRPTDEEVQEYRENPEPYLPKRSRQ